MKFGNTVRVGISRYLTKITTLRRKANREQLRVLAANHTTSLQLLCTVGGSQATLDARTEFEISQRSPNGGGEAGRAHHCTTSYSDLNPIPVKYGGATERPLIQNNTISFGI